jgi:hypothetical protein
MAHGYAGVKEHGITRFAEAFADADAGFVVLLHDHRTPLAVIAGHKIPENTDDPHIIGETRQYIRDFIALDGYRHQGPTSSLGRE